MFVVLVYFSWVLKNILAHCKESKGSLNIETDTGHSSSIHNKLIIVLKTAVENGKAVPEKEVTSEVHIVLTSAVTGCLHFC
jgi:hypothetical protein